MIEYNDYCFMRMPALHAALSNSLHISRDLRFRSTRQECFVGHSGNGCGSLKRWLKVLPKLLFPGKTA